MAESLVRVEGRTESGFCGALACSFKWGALPLNDGAFENVRLPLDEFTDLPERPRTWWHLRS